MADAVTLTTLKFLVIGDSGTGKSSLLVRFVDGEFDEDQGPTIGVDFKSKVVNINGNPLKLTIWDTAGQERFRTLTASYYRGAHGIILVYDVSRRESFEHVAMWLNEVDVYSTNENAVKMLIGNKVDLDREVETSEGRDFARQHNMLFIECSAKTEKGVKDAFQELSQKVLDTPDLWQEGNNSGVKLGKSEPSLAEAAGCGGCGF